MNKPQLLEIAKGLDHEAVKGYTQMNKDHLIEAICKAMDIPMHEHHEVVGVNKTAIRQNIRELKKKRDNALAAKKPDEYRAARKKIKELKHALRKATV
ncbi:hypothetical protein JXO52_03225 [bacterium]|nr:hypothetical protein [bacterium]